MIVLVLLVKDLNPEASKMAPWVMVLATKSDDLNLISGSTW